MGQRPSEPDQKQNPEPFLDLPEMGRLFRAARILASYSRVVDAVAALSAGYQLHVSPRTLYAIERGEQAASVSVLLGLALLYSPPGGIDFFMPAFRPDIRREVARFYGRPYFNG